MQHLHVLTSPLRSAMGLRIKTYPLVFLFLFICLSSGMIEAFGDNANLGVTDSPHKGGGIQLIPRKLLVGADMVLDYEGPGSNPKHDPGKGNPTADGGSTPPESIHPASSMASTK